MEPRPPSPAPAVAATPLPSATILMLRDGAGGIEVFLLKRGDSKSFGGAYVFPGGKVDREDAELAGRLDRPAAELHAALGEPGLSHVQAAAMYVAAIREAFEETGVLYAPVGADRAREAWALLHEGRQFDETLDLLGHGLTTTGLAPWARWITPTAPQMAVKRFDARFFVAAVPAGQEPVHDSKEAVDSVWLTPREALLRHADGRILFAPPQIMTLFQISRLPDVAAVLAAARSASPPLVAPEIHLIDGQRMLALPGDPLHSVAERALPGPTRMTWRDNRVMPLGGIEELLNWE